MESSERGFLLSEEWSSVDALVCRMADLQALESRINLALQDKEITDDLKEKCEVGDDKSPPGDADESNKISCKFDIPSRCIIRPEYAAFIPRLQNINVSWSSFSSHLTSLHTTITDLLERRRKMERQLQVDYGGTFNFLLAVTNSVE